MEIHELTRASIGSRDRLEVLFSVVFEVAQLVSFQLSTDFSLKRQHSQQLVDNPLIYDDFVFYSF